MIDRHFKIGLGLLLCVPLAYSQMGMQGNQPLAPHAKKKSTSTRDPSFSKALPVAKLDKESEAALKRSQKPGVLQAASAVANHVYEIRIVGVKKTEPEAILVLLKTHIDEIFEPVHIAEDIRRIFKMGLFEDIQVGREPGPNQSIKLVYQLKEKSTISQIRFIGNENISEDDLKEVVDLKQHHIADLYRVKENAEKIRKLYSDKGFLLTHVSYELKTSNDLSDVIFHIEEESKIRVEKINVLGNQVLSQDLIKSQMRTQEKHPLSFVTQWGVFNEDMLEIDGLLIEQLYQEHGFLNVQVSKPRATLSPDKTRITVHISIVEGESYRLGHLSIGGDLLEHGEDDLRSKISLHPGDVFNKTKISHDILSIQELFQDQGYAYVNISPVHQINESEQTQPTVDLRLEVEPGSLVYFGRFDIKGNSTTMDDVIRRELRIYEGELYSSSMLRLSEQRLNQLGYFESVKLVSKPSQKPDVMDIDIEVKEKRLGSVQVGGGYGTGGEGFMLQAQLSQNNLFGRGQALMGTIQWSAYRRIFELQFMDPYLAYIGNVPLAFSIRAYDTQRYLVDFYRASTGSEISFGYPIGSFLSPISTEWFKNASPEWEPYVPDFENLRVFLSFTGERVSIEDNLRGINYWGWHLGEPRYTTSLKPMIQLDQRNNRLLPSAGYLLEWRTEFASSYLGSVLLADLENQISHNSTSHGIDAGLSFLKQDATSNNFIRHSANMRFYYNFDRWFFLKNWVLKLNLDMGLIDTLGVQLVSENFRLGGVQMGSPTGLRGYYFQSVGPVINVGQQLSTQPISQLTVGGNKQFMANLELEFPLIKAVKLSGVAFLDLGNVYAPGEGFFYAGNSNIKNRYKNYWDPLGLFYGLGLFSSVGVGVRWFSPLGALRFEWGFPLVKRPPGTPGMPAGDSAMQFLFTIGQSF